jgi:hypothetical protein
MENVKALSGKAENHQTYYIYDDSGNPLYDPKQTAEIFNTFFFKFIQKCRKYHKTNNCK